MNTINHVLLDHLLSQLGRLDPINIGQGQQGSVYFRTEVAAQVFAVKTHGLTFGVMRSCAQIEVIGSAHDGVPRSVCAIAKANKKRGRGDPTEAPAKSPSTAGVRRLLPLVGVATHWSGLGLLDEFAADGCELVDLGRVEREGAGCAIAIPRAPIDEQVRTRCVVLDAEHDCILVKDAPGAALAAWRLADDQLGVDSAHDSGFRLDLGGAIGVDQIRPDAHPVVRAQVPLAHNAIACGDQRLHRLRRNSPSLPPVFDVLTLGPSTNDASQAGWAHPYDVHDSIDCIHFSDPRCKLVCSLLAN